MIESPFFLLYFHQVCLEGLQTLNAAEKQHAGKEFFALILVEAQ